LTRSRDNATNVAGDISGVTAGTGLTGGGTGGTVTLDLTTPVASTNGGTGLSSFTTGDMIYSSSGNTLAKLGIGTTSQVLTVASGTPAWTTPAASVKTIGQIAKGNVPSASSFTISGLTQDYFMLRLNNLKWAGGANGAVFLRINGNSSAIYTFLVVTTATGDTYTYFDPSFGNFWGLDTVANKKDANNYRVIEIHNGKGSGYHSYTMRGHHHDGGGTSRGVIAGGWVAESSPITSISVHQMDGYTFTEGSYELIGG